MRAVLAARSRRVALTAPALVWLQLAAKTVPAAAAPRFAMLMAAVLAARTQPRLAQAGSFRSAAAGGPVVPGVAGDCAAGARRRGDCAGLADAGWPNR